MVQILVREPRPGAAAKKPDLLRPGATITVAGLTPEAGASLAVVRWTSPAGGGKGGKSLDPSSMELLALQELPFTRGGEGAPRDLDVEAARAAIAAALPAPSPDSPVFLYTKDSTGGGGQVEEAVQERLDRIHEALLQAVQGVPVTSTGRVASNVMSRSLGINAHSRRTSAALDTARAVFPQAADRLRSVSKDAGLANALLVVAHVVGASIVKGDVATEESGAETPRSTATGSVRTPAAAAAAAAAPATEPPKRSRRREGEAGSPTAGGASGGLQQQWQGVLPIVDMSQLAQRQQQLAGAAQAPAPALAAPAAAMQVAAPPGGQPAISAEQYLYLRSLQSPQYQQTYQQALAALNQQGQGQGLDQGQGQAAGPGSPGGAGGSAGGGPTAAGAAAVAGPSSGSGQLAPPDLGSAPVSPSGSAPGLPAVGQRFGQATPAEQFGQAASQQQAQFDPGAELVQQAQQVAQQAWQHAQQAQQQAQQAQQQFDVGELLGAGGSPAEGGNAAGSQPPMPTAVSAAAPLEASPAPAEPAFGGLQAS
ncbi:hypothetical protein ABPG75_012041 [Micractinium tetrahymenae]